MAERLRRLRRAVSGASWPETWAQSSARLAAAAAEARRATDDGYDLLAVRIRRGTTINGAVVALCPAAGRDGRGRRVHRRAAGPVKVGPLPDWERELLDQQAAEQQEAGRRRKADAACLRNAARILHAQAKRETFALRVIIRVLQRTADRIGHPWPPS